MSVFSRLTRFMADVLVDRGIDEYVLPAQRHQQLDMAMRGRGVRGRLNDQAVRYVTANIPNPVGDPPRPIHLGPGWPTPQVSYDLRRRHGEGLFGLEPLIAEGDS